MRKLNYYLTFCLLLGAAGLLASCDQNPEYQAVNFGPASPVAGVVIAMDEFQKPLPADLQPNIDVALLNGDGGTAGSGSAKGGTEFRIEGVAGGMYSVSVSAAGFQTLVRPSVSHGGGTETRIDTTYLVQSSTTTITDLVASPLVLLTRLRILTDYVLLANTDLAVTAGDTIIFLNRQVTPSVNVNVVPRQDTVLRYEKDTVYYKPRFDDTYTTYLNTVAKLSQGSTDSTLRGALFVLSPDGEPTAENYKMIRTKVQARRNGTGVFGETLSLRIPLSTLESAGIITASNRRVHVAAYGLSGRLFAYGASQSPDRLFYLYPTRNLIRSSVMFADF